ncbi:MAG: hypothetical protein JSV35_04125, partial [Candidatus Bathyarchaeota archaeon]
MSNPAFDSIADIELSKDAEAAQQQAMFITDLNVTTEFEHPVRIAILTIMRQGIPDTSTTESVDEHSGDRIIVRKPVTRNALS